MKGFFSKKELQSVSRPDGKVYSCASCGLYKDLQTPRMKPSGNFRKGIMNITEAPSLMDDQKGKLFQGRIGRLLQKTYADLGVNLWEDCINIPACFCCPLDDSGKSRTPTNYEVDSCRKKLWEYIKHYKPKVVVSFGNGALYSLLGRRWPKDLGTIYKWRGWNIPDQDLKTWVCPTFDPGFVLERDEEVRTIWKKDLQQALNLINKPFPFHKEPDIQIIKDLKELERVKVDLVAFDYETTGLKPQAPGHRVVCASLAYSPDQCYAFLMPKSKQAREPFLKILRNSTVSKMAHNLKFEETWTRVRLQTVIERWEWCSMLAAHLIDNRSGVTGLKFQTYVNFGVIDYSSEIEPYLRSKEENNGNAFNDILKLLETAEGTQKLLHYCALDSVYEYRLALKQMELLKYDFLPF